jgi:epidermal growth factor receptor substrate 15
MVCLPVPAAEILLIVLCSHRNLADTQNRGSLDATDFCIAMYIIQATMSGQLSFVPTSLPPGLYDQASGKFDAVATHATGSSLQPSPSTSRFPAGPVQPQYTGGLQPQLTGRGPAPNIPPRSSVVTGPSKFNQPTPFGVSPTPQWDITPTEKANSDRFFDGLDTTKKGYIEADAAVPFMMQSNLSEEVLAQIWWGFVVTLADRTLTLEPGTCLTQARRVGSRGTDLRSRFI